MQKSAVTISIETGDKSALFHAILPSSSSKQLIGQVTYTANMVLESYFNDNASDDFNASDGGLFNNRNKTESIPEELASASRV